MVFKFPGSPLYPSHGGLFAAATISPSQPAARCQSESARRRCQSESARSRWQSESSARRRGPVSVRVISPPQFSESRRRLPARWLFAGFKFFLVQVFIIGIHTPAGTYTASSFNDVSRLDVFPFVQLLVLVLLGGYLDDIFFKLRGWYDDCVVRD